MIKMKCPKCGERVVYPWRVADESDVKRWVWRNVFRIDWTVLVFAVIFLIVAWAYQHDVNAYRGALSDPPGLCGGYCQSQYGYVPIGGFRNVTGLNLSEVKYGWETNSTQRINIS